MAILVAGQMNLLGDRFDPQRIVVFGIPAACVVYGAVALEAQKLLNVPSILSALGDSSYSMYLIQVFTIPVVGKGWKVLGLANHVGPWAALIFAIAVTMGVAHILYLIFERPMTNFLRHAAASHLMRHST